MSRLPWYVHTLGRMIGYTNVQSKMPDGRWVRAVPEPYHALGLERFKAAWWVFTGKAHAVVWPKAGEFEAVVNRRLP